MRRAISVLGLLLALSCGALVLAPTPASAADPTAICRDTSLSFSAHRSGTCSYHGGVAQWCPCAVAQPAATIPPTVVTPPPPPAPAPPPAPPPAPAPVSAPVGCRFIQGFALLRDQVPASVGTCLDGQSYGPNGDGIQHTTAWHGKGGLLVWRKADNWTAFTDGATTWINGPLGVQSRPNAGPCFSWEAC